MQIEHNNAVFKRHLKISQSRAFDQWRSQPDNLVPQCKFQSIIIIHFFRNRLFSQSVIFS